MHRFQTNRIYLFSACSWGTSAVSFFPRLSLQAAIQHTSDAPGATDNSGGTFAKGTDQGPDVSKISVYWGRVELLLYVVIRTFDTAPWKALLMHLGIFFSDVLLAKGVF